MWGYKGLVMTDWGGNYSFTLDNGVTMETPSDTHNNPENIQAAFRCRRNHAGRYRLRSSLQPDGNGVRQDILALSQSQKTEQQQ